MKTLTIELPARAALKYEALERKHGEAVSRLLEMFIVKMLARIEGSTEMDLNALEEEFIRLEDEDDEREFQQLANYIVEKNAELYRRLA